MLSLETDGWFTLSWLPVLAGIAFLFLRGFGQVNPGNEKLIPRVSFFDSLRIFLSACPHKVISQLKRKYGAAFKVRVGSNDFVVIADLDMVLELDRQYSSVLMGKPVSTTASMVGAAHANEGKRWRKCRGIVMSSIKSFFGESSDTIHGVLLGEVQVLLANLTRQVNTDHYTKSIGRNTAKMDDVQREITTFVVRCMFRLVYGNGRDIQEDYLRDLRHIADGVQHYARNTGPFSKLDYFPWMKLIYGQGYNRLRDFMKVVKNLCAVNKHHRTADGDPEARQDQEKLDDIMAFFKRSARGLTNEVQQTYGLTEDGLYDTLEDFVRAGSETAASILHWAAIVWAKHSDIQRRMFDEICNILGPVATPTFDELDSLPFCKAVFYEVLRFCTLNPFVRRRLLDRAKIAGLSLAPGTTLLINNYVINRDPTKWQHPDDFRPERFLTASGTFDSDKLALFIPFGFGRRRCAGERLGIVLILFSMVSLIQRFHFDPPSNERPCLDDVYGITLTPKYFHVRLRDINYKEGDE